MVEPLVPEPGVATVPLLKIEDLAFGYAGPFLLYGVNMQVWKGELIGLLGPNGSGKTTLLRLISGVLKLQQGHILLDGRELATWSRRALARQIAVVPQELQVPFAFTVEQMVALGRTPFITLFGNKTDRDRAMVQEAMRVAEVDLLAQRIFNELSGGERQRVMVAMALAQEPRLLLLDEPTSHLDIRYQIDMLELVQRLNRETGVTVIAAMHDLNLAARYFPRLLLFQRGVVADGGPVEVLEPRLLKRVYGVDVQVGVMRGAEHLSVLPPRDPTSHEERQDESQVHLMAGAGSGTLVMRALADEHIGFSVGVLNIGDSDYPLALWLASELITEQPFAPISEATRERLSQRLQKISLLIVCAMPIGPGNLALLQEALTVPLRGTRVLLVSSVEKPNLPVGKENSLQLAEYMKWLNTAERDYAAGEGTRLLSQLLEAGAIVVSNVAEIIEYARQAVTDTN
jgi:iron complex transport system ATP-binding protein